MLIIRANTSGIRKVDNGGGEILPDLLVGIFAISVLDHVPDQ